MNVYLVTSYIIPLNVEQYVYHYKYLIVYLSLTYSQGASPYAVWTISTALRNKVASQR